MSVFSCRTISFFWNMTVIFFSGFFFSWTLISETMMVRLYNGVHLANEIKSKVISQTDLPDLPTLNQNWLREIVLSILTVNWKQWTWCIYFCTLNLWRKTWGVNEISTVTHLVVSRGQQSQAKPNFPSFEHITKLIYHHSLFCMS